MAQMCSLIGKLEYHVAHQAGNVSYLTNPFRIASCNTGTLHLKLRVCTKQMLLVHGAKSCVAVRWRQVTELFFVVAWKMKWSSWGQMIAETKITLVSVCHFLCAYLISSLYLRVISSYIHFQDLIERNEERGWAVKLPHSLLFVLVMVLKRDELT